MSLLIKSFKPHPTMLIGQLNEKTTLIDFETDEVEEAPAVTTAVRLVGMNTDADTITYSLYPPDQLTSINNLQTSTPLTIYKYDVPNHAERFGFHYQPSSQENTVRIYAFEDDTRLFRQTGTGPVSYWRTIDRYQKIDNYTPATDETYFSNKPICQGAFSGYPSYSTHQRGRSFLCAARSSVGQVRFYTLHDNTTVKYQPSAQGTQTTVVIPNKHTETSFNISLGGGGDFATVDADQDVCCFSTSGGNDTMRGFPASQEIFMPLDQNPRVFIWDRANPTTAPSVTLIVQYSDATTNTVFNLTSTRQQALTTKDLQNGFARVFLQSGTSSDIVISGHCTGDGAGNDGIGALTGPKFLSSRIAYDDSVDSSPHLGPIIYGVQYTSGVNTLYLSDLTLSATGAGSTGTPYTVTPTHVNTQADGVKLLTYDMPAQVPVVTNWRKQLFDVSHTTTLIFSVTQVNTKEQKVIGNTPLMQNVTPHAEDYTINSRTAVAFNHTGVSQTIGLPNAIYDTSTFGISTLAVFSRNGTDINRTWIKLSAHGVDGGYFGVVRYGSTNYICIQFRGFPYSDAATQMVSFPFSSLSNPSNHVVYASVRESSSETFDFHLELWSFTTAGTEALVDKKSFTVNIPYVENNTFQETSWLSAIDNINTQEEDDYSSITIAQVDYYKGNHTETDRDALIQAAITYWTT